ncbi:hypothetical protein IMZ48_03695 [Candidatus Bathyarchaeota archaeon]|nr:hypothetical protein [Candidatus Bathyarchaeota archaeon]
MPVLQDRVLLADSDLVPQTARGTAEPLSSAQPRSIANTYLTIRSTPILGTLLGKQPLKPRPRGARHLPLQIPIPALNSRIRSHLAQRVACATNRRHDAPYASLNDAVIRRRALPGGPSSHHPEEESGASELPRMPDEEVSAPIPCRPLRRVYTDIC